MKSKIKTDENENKKRNGFGKFPSIQCSTTFSTPPHQILFLISSDTQQSWYISVCAFPYCEGHIFALSSLFSIVGFYLTSKNETHVIIMLLPLLGNDCFSFRVLNFL